MKLVPRLIHVIEPKQVIVFAGDIKEDVLVYGWNVKCTRNANGHANI